MKALKFFILFSLFSAVSCKKKSVERTLDDSKWNYTSTVTYNDGESDKTVINTGVITFDKNKTGVQAEAETNFNYNFYWINSEDVCNLEFTPLDVAPSADVYFNRVQTYIFGGYINYQILVNESKHQEWEGFTTYRIDSERSFSATIKLVLNQ